MDVGRGVSNRTLAALKEVIAEEEAGELEPLFYAWKIHDGIEDRVWLSLSQTEAEEWESISDVQVTVVSWQQV